MRLLLGLLFVALVAPAFAANQLTVDRTTVLTNGVVTITVTLEGPYAAMDAVDLTLRNLRITEAPSVSSEFSWINGESRRTKVFRYRARPLGAGPAQVGPLALSAGDARTTLPAVPLNVVADRAAASNEPATILRELEASGRDPLFVVATADRERVYAGEPVVVTWFLYNGTSVQQSRIVSMPQFRDFWVEEIDVRSVPVEEVIVGNRVLQKVPIRRVALAPLRSGRFEIGGIVIEAAVMRRLRTSPLDMFEGAIEELTYTSAGLTLDALPVPEGPPVQATGVLALACAGPQAARGGPVTIDVTLSGRGNVRAATAPRFARAVAGKVEVEDRGVEVEADDGFSMTRRWRYLLFPNASGELAVPPLTFLVFDTKTAQRRELRCGGGSVRVSSALRPNAPPPSAEPEQAPVTWRRYLPAAAGAVLILIGVVVALPRAVRAMRTRSEAARLIGDTPTETRARIDAHLGRDTEVLKRDPGERGEAYRALMSLLAAAERDQAIAADWRGEAKQRLRDLLDAG